MTESLPSESGSAPATSSEASQAPAATESQDVNSTSTSSGDDKGAKASSVFEAVNSALTEGKASGDSPAPNSPATDAPTEAELLSDEVSKDELNRYHSRTRKRIQHFIERTKGQATEIGRLKPLAEQAERLNGFVQQSGLDWDEVNSGFELMRLMKTNPIEAREKLEPIWNALNRACGFELTPELKQKVDLGYVDEATAQQLSQAQARAHIVQNANQRTVEQIQQAQQEATHRQATQSVKSAVSTFESQWKKSDPDFAAKYPRVMEKVELTLSRKAMKGERLTSPADAVKIIEDAKKAVEAELKPYVQKREPIAPLPNGAIAANGSPRPKSMADAVAMGLRG